MDIDMENVQTVDENLDLTTADRGNTVPEPTDAKIDEPVPTEQRAEEKGAEAAKPDDERPRDENGRFIKDGKDDPAPKDDKDDKDDDIRIPKSRFDKQIGRERERAEQAERRAQDLEARLKTQEVAEDMEAAKGKLRDMIKQRNAFLADGEMDKAAEIDEKMFDFQQQVANAQAERKAMTAKDLAKEEMRYDTVVAHLELDYPQINPDTEEYDAAAVGDIRAIMVGLQQTQRMDPAQALSKAVKMVLGEPGKAAAAVDKPKPADADKGKEAKAERKAEAVNRNAAVSGKQPPTTAEVGIDHDKAGGALNAADVMKMTSEEFAKLPESVLSKMRGDLLA